jgi:hypothetical protein
LSQFPGVQLYNPDHASWIKNAVTVLNGYLVGKLNVTFTASLSTTGPLTTLSDSRIRSESFIAWMPTNTAAAVEFGAGTLQVAEPGRVNGSVVITHSNTSSVRNFRFLVMG